MRDPGRRTIDQMRFTITVGVAISCIVAILYASERATTWARGREADIAELKAKHAALTIELQKLQAESYALRTAQSVTDGDRKALQAHISHIQSDLRRISENIDWLTQLYFSGEGREAPHPRTNPP